MKNTVAKTLILAVVAFGRGLIPQQVVRRGITTLTREQMQQALAEGKRIKHVASLRSLSTESVSSGRLTRSGLVCFLFCEKHLASWSLE